MQIEETWTDMEIKAEKIWNGIGRQVKWQLIQIYKNDTSRQAGRQEDKYVKDRQYCSSVTKRKYSRIEGAASVDKGVTQPLCRLHLSF